MNISVFREKPRETLREISSEVVAEVIDIKQLLDSEVTPKVMEAVLELILIVLSQEIVLAVVQAKADKIAEKGWMERA